jgi:glucosamine--fructose-6-phosphate aminotransferase (isomerizing)
MTVPTTYPTRPWIPAQDSFQDQPAVLRALPQQLSTQLSTVPDRPSRLLFVGIGASHAAAASGVHRMRSMGIDATRHLPGELAGVTDSDLVIATSQSGRSAEVVDLVKGIDSENVLR